MKETEITTEEKILLKEHLLRSPMVVIRLKCHALLTHDKGMEIEDIADIISRDEKTIFRWMKEWRETRMASIFTGHEHNTNASKLTGEQREEIKKTLEKPPSAYGIPKEFWDVPSLKEYIRVKFDTVYESDRSYHYLLGFSNLSFKYPDRFDRHRDERVIEVRMGEIRQEIEPLLKRSDWEVFASDEVRMELEAFTRRAWLKRGERTIIRVERKREAQSYLGLLNQKNFRCHVFELKWQNQEEILKALKQFLTKYPKKRICILWDNAAFHKGKEIRKALRKGEILERVHLINLPPYAPDHNPIEHVWNTAKKSMANIQHDDFETMKETFTRFVSHRKFRYQI